MNEDRAVDHRRFVWLVTAAALVLRLGAVLLWSPPEAAELFEGPVGLFGSDAALTVLVVFASLHALSVPLVYRWVSPWQPWAVTRLACLGVALHPMLIAAPYDFGHGLVWLLVLAFVGGENRKVVSVTVGVLALLHFLRFWVFGLMVAASEPVNAHILARFDPWSFWYLAGSGVPLRSVLAGYLFEGPVYGLAAVGCWHIVRAKPRRLVLPTVLVALTWMNVAWTGIWEFTWLTRVSILPILILFASIGAWHVYVGLGRSSGHGILAIDPVKEQRPVRPPA